MPLKLNIFTGNLDIVNKVVTVESKSAAFTAEDKKTYLVDSSGGAVTVTLPAPKSGVTISIKDIGNAETNNITINPNAAEDIDGTSSYVITSNFETIKLTSDGTDYFII